MAGTDRGQGGNRPRKTVAVKNIFQPIHIFVFTSLRYSADYAASVADGAGKINMKNIYIYENQTLADLQHIAENLAGIVQKGDVVLLEGDLGAGKTAFARVFLRHLAQNPELEVPSPTFTLVQQYETPKGEVWHFDLYRLEDADEMLEIGWDEALTSAVSLIEWPERLGAYMPDNFLKIQFKFSSQDADLRDIFVYSGGDAMTERCEINGKSGNGAG